MIASTLAARLRVAELAIEHERTRRDIDAAIEDANLMRERCTVIERELSTLVDVADLPPLFCVEHIACIRERGDATADDVWRFAEASPHIDALGHEYTTQPINQNGPLKAQAANRGHADA